MTNNVSQEALISAERLYDLLHYNDRSLELEELIKLYSSDPKDICDSFVYNELSDIVTGLKQDTINETVAELETTGQMIPAWRAVIEQKIKDFILHKYPPAPIIAPATSPPPPPPVAKTPEIRTLNYFYLAILIFVIIIVSLLVIRGLMEKPSVEIDFDVGEIIGGLLGGGGIAAAGGAYAFKIIIELSDKMGKSKPKISKE